MSEEERKRGARALAEEERKAGAGDAEEIPGDTPDFSNPSDVVVWHGRQVIYLLGLMRREKAAARLRCLNSAIDAWSKCIRLAIDSSELEAVKKDLLALRQQIENDRKSGPTGLVKKA